MLLRRVGSMEPLNFWRSAGAPRTIFSSFIMENIQEYRNIRRTQEEFKALQAIGSLTFDDQTEAERHHPTRCSCPTIPRWRALNIAQGSRSAALSPAVIAGNIGCGRYWAKSLPNRVYFSLRQLSFLYIDRLSIPITVSTSLPNLLAHHR
jgi:hypothetical protein